MLDSHRFWEWVNELRAAESVYREAATEAVLARVLCAEAGLREALRELRGKGNGSQWGHPLASRAVAAGGGR